MNLSDYIQLPREQRIAHTNLATDCILVEPGKRRKARRVLLNHLGIPEQTLGRGVHCCHLCEHNSRAELVCVNPLHMYMGTNKENARDIPEEVRVNVAKIAQAAQPPASPELRKLRSQISLEINAKRTPEERSAIAKKRARNIKQNNSYTTEQRSAAAKKARAAQTPEQRSQATREGWETRRRNQQGG